MRRVLLWLVGVYRSAIGPYLRSACRFEPTCSAYALDALEKKRGGEAIMLIAGRLGRCHPWGGSGWDPVPAEWVAENERVGRG